MAANLHYKLIALWNTGSGSIRHDSGLFRLTSAIAQLKANVWISDTLADNVWNVAVLSTEYRDISALLVRKTELNNHYDDEGNLLECINFLITGDAALAVTVFQKLGLSCKTGERHESWSILILGPDN